VIEQRLDIEEWRALLTCVNHEVKRLSKRGRVTKLVDFRDEAGRDLQDRASKVPVSITYIT
jgi:hypothetical protein